MTLQTRLKKLETAARPVSKDGLCNCPATDIRLYYPGNEPPADMPLVETCDVCGGERRVRKIELIDRHDQVRDGA
jgi:hypothetical protein